MAGARVDMPVNGAADWSSFVDIVQHMMQPFMSVSLTHMDDALEPEIESVSTIIVKGTCYKFAADEAVTGWAAIGSNTEVYLYIVPAGAACTAVWSSVAPTWDSDYQGYYNGNNRCIGGACKDWAGTYTRKWLYRGATSGIMVQAIQTVNALIGTGLPIAGIGAPALAALNATDVAFLDVTWTSYGPTDGPGLRGHRLAPAWP